jgi:hypothetical protein
MGMTKTFFDRKAFAAGAILTVVLVSSTEVYAGGLFGDGGLFRGTVGNWLDKHVEEPITTPIAQGVGQVVGQAMAATSESWTPFIGQRLEQDKCLPS